MLAETLVVAQDVALTLIFVRLLNRTSVKRPRCDNLWSRSIGVTVFIALMVILGLVSGFISGVVRKVIYLVCLIVFAKVFYMNYLVENIVMSLIYYTTSMVINSVVADVYSRFIDWPCTPYILTVLSTTLLFVVTEFVLSNILDYKNYVFTNKEFIFLFSLGGVSFWLMATYEWLDVEFFVDFIVIICVVSNLVVSALVKIIRGKEKNESLLIERNKFLEKQDKLIREKEEARYKSYQKSVDFDDQIRRINHDLMHHFNYLLDCDGLPQRAKDYINKLKGTVSEASNYFSTGSSILDLILEEKCKQAEKAGIKFRVIGDFSDGLDLEPASVSIVFGNLLNNAIEGASKVSVDQYRVIDVVFYQEPHHRIYVKISNTACTKDLVINNGKIETTKEDKKMHGIGLDSVNKEISKYNGRVMMSVEDDNFIVEIIVPVH